MHTKISYAAILDEAIRKKAALQDVIDWLGKPRFEQLVEAFRAEPPRVLAQFHFLASMTGIQGYPVRVWFEHIWPDAPCLTCEHDWQPLEEDRDENGRLKSINMLGTHKCTKCGDYDSPAPDGTIPPH